MHRVNRLTKQFALLAVLMLAACQGGSRAPMQDEGAPAAQFQPQTLSEVLSELDGLQTPPGADSATFAQLKSGLREQLLNAGVTKYTAKLPKGPSSVVNDLTLVDNGNGTATLTWTYRNRGDYGLDGLVSIADLTPLGANLGDVVGPGSSADGDGNGQINIADLTPLGAGLSNAVSGYEVFALGDGTSACWDSVGMSPAGRFEHFDFPVMRMEVPYTGTEQFVVLPYNSEEAADPYGADDPPTPTEPPPPPPPPPANGSITGVVADTLGQPLVDVSVQIADLSLTTMTDTDGRYLLSDIEPADERVLTLTHADYAEGCVRVPVLSGQSTQADVTLLARPAPVVIDASAGGVVEGMLTQVKLTLPPNALVDRDGNPLNINVDVQLTYIDPTDPERIAAAPGDMSATLLSGDEAQLESFGMAEVFIDDGSGEAANLAPGKEAELEYQIPFELQATAPPTIGLFSFDPESGDWIEEGVAVKNPGGTAYIAQVPHFSYWNCDLPLDYTCVKVRVESPTGTPISGAYVEGAGVDYTGSSYKHSNEDGYAYFHVKPGGTEQFKAALQGLGGYGSDPVEAVMPPENGKCDTLQDEDIPLVATLILDPVCASVMVTV
nr:carboxypeptidase regulatory-like domain-containing protein [bacterium]